MGRPDGKTGIFYRNAVIGPKLFPPLMLCENEAINALHQAYCNASGYHVPINYVFERQWYEAKKLGVTPEDIRLVVRDRLKRISAGARRKESVYLRNIAGNDEAIADVLVEAAALRASGRVKVFSPGKAEVLRATGREDAPPDQPARSVGELIENLRRAAAGR